MLDDDVLKVELIVVQQLPDLVEQLIVHLTQRLAGLDSFSDLNRREGAALELGKFVFKGQRWFLIGTAGRKGHGCAQQCNSTNEPQMRLTPGDSDTKNRAHINDPTGVDQVDSTHRRAHPPVERGGARLLGRSQAAIRA